MEESLSAQLILLPAAGPAAALAAAPGLPLQTGRCYFRDAHCEKGQKSPSIQLAENVRKVGGTHVSLRSIGEFGCDSGYTGDKTLLVTHGQIRQFGDSMALKRTVPKSIALKNLSTCSFGPLTSHRPLENSSFRCALPMN